MPGRGALCDAARRAWPASSGRGGSRSSASPPTGAISPPQLARFAAAHGLRFPILRDVGGAVAARLGATRTPEVVVLDEPADDPLPGPDRRPVRRRLAPGRGRGAATWPSALEDLLAGRPVSRPETEARRLPDRAARPARPMPAAVTYCRDIAPILQRRCVGCHRPGQIGPFSLTTYRQAAGWAEAIAEAVEEGRMPPWHADPRHGQFANDARLTDREKRLIADWARGGAPEGDPADLPPPAAYPGGWRIPGPDLVVSMPGPFTVPAEGVVDYQTFEVDPGFREDRWVRGAEIRPGNRKVVHHCNVFLKPPGEPRRHRRPGGARVVLPGRDHARGAAAWSCPTGWPSGSRPAGGSSSSSTTRRSAPPRPTGPASGCSSPTRGRSGRKWPRT